MNDEPCQTLGQMIAQYGTELCHEPRRIEALLRDLCGSHKMEVNALVVAARERVPQELLSATSATPIGITLTRLQQRLQDDLGLAESVAEWAVTSWAVALGVAGAVASKPVGTVCARCHSPYAPDDYFCEKCSAPLVATVLCRNTRCKASRVAMNVSAHDWKYCRICGDSL